MRPVRDTQMTVRDERPDWRDGKIDGIVGVKKTGEITLRFSFLYVSMPAFH